MPELPDVALYVEALASRIVARRLIRIQLKSPFLLRSVDPPLEAVTGLPATTVRRIGKRIVVEFPGHLFVVLHLMIAGRLRWREPGQKPGVGGRMVLAVFEFEHGSLIVTEAGTTRRASLTLVRGEDGLAALNRGGIEPLDASLDAFRAALMRERHTIKRALTDPRIVSGIGNAYSDEILHAARLSPFALTSALTPDEVARLYGAVRGTLRSWVERLRAEAAGGFPEQVTAFREGMAVHGRYRQPCPDCGAPVQRIVYAANECNYCARCQTGGRVLADRALSRLLGDDWPRRLDENEPA